MDMVQKDTDLQRRQFLLRLMAHMGIQGEEREDLAHQALLRFYSRGYDDRVSEESAVRALLARIGYSVVVDASRRRRAEREIVEADVVSDDAARVADIRWARELLTAARLDVNELRLLEDRFGRGRSLEAIASSHGCHLNTIRRRLAAILARLRRAARSDEVTPALECGRDDEHLVAALWEPRS